MNNDTKNTLVDVTPTLTDNEDKKGGNGKDSKTFTQEEVNTIVSERVKEINSKNETAISEAVNTAIAEYERKAKLTQEEKDKEERTKREKEIAEREQSIALREMRIEATNMLIDKHIPIELVDFVVDVDATKTKENIEKLTKTYSKSVEDGVTEKLKGKPIDDFSNNNDYKKDKKPINTAF